MVKPVRFSLLHLVLVGLYVRLVPELTPSSIRNLLYIDVFLISFLIPNMKDILASHVSFIEKTYGKPLDSISSNIGWVHTGTSITSKIYEFEEYVETFWQDGNFVHDIVPMK